VIKASPHFAVVLMGVSGCGKSTVGRLLAADLACIFIDADDYHEAACIAKMKAGVPLDDEDRRPWLDRVGLAIRAAANDGSCVVACSALKKAYRDRLVAHAGMPISFVLLDASRDELLSRMRGRTDHFMPVSLLDSQFAALERPSIEEHALTLNVGVAPEALCATIREWLHRHQT
jgi:gluconokinase